MSTPPQSAATSGCRPPVTHPSDGSSQSVVVARESLLLARSTCSKARAVGRRERVGRPPASSSTAIRRTWFNTTKYWPTGDRRVGGRNRLPVPRQQRVELLDHATNGRSEPSHCRRAAAAAAVAAAAGKKEQILRRRIYDDTWRIQMPSFNVFHSVTQRN